MFKKSIAVTALTSDSANEFFTNIRGGSYNGDVTFIATLRALIYPRMSEGESISLSVGRSDYKADDISSQSPNRMVERICENMYIDNGTFYVHNLASRSDADSDANIALLKSHFTERFDGWHEVDKISEFYRKSFKIICFVNEERKCAAVFVDRLNLQKWHYLQMSILAILTWYHDPAKGVSEAEMNLIKSLCKREPDEYEACIAKIAETYDFETARLKRLLDGFETRYEQMECGRVEREIASVDRSIDRLSDEFANYHSQRNDLCIRLLGLRQRIAEGGNESSEIMNFFLCNRNLRLESVENTTITFVVRTYLDYFDEELVQRAINKRASTIFSRTSTGMNSENIERFMKAVFVDQKLRIRFCAAYRFDLNGSVRALSSYHFDSSCAEYMPNPHIQQFHCLGGYEREINKLLVKGDYIGAIAQCTASAKSLNFGDSTVILKFMEWVVSGPNNKCVELPDGKVVTPSDAVKWLREQEKASAATEEVSMREE